MTTTKPPRGEAARATHALAERLNTLDIPATAGADAEMAYIDVLGMHFCSPVLTGNRRAPSVDDSLAALALGIEHVRNLATLRMAKLRATLAALEAADARWAATLGQLNAAAAAEGGKR